MAVKLYFEHTAGRADEMRKGRHRWTTIGLRGSPAPSNSLPQNSLIKGMAGMIHKALILTLAIFLSGQTEPPWQDFDLEEIQVDGLTVHYEKSLSAEVEGIRQALSDFLKQGAKHFAQVDDLKSKSDEIIEQVNAIVGFSPTEEEATEQRKILSTFLAMQLFPLTRPEQKTTIYLLTMESTKDYLRKGGSLPGCTYDKEKDRAGYNLVLADSDSAGPKGERKVVIPIPAENAANRFAGFLTMLAKEQYGTKVGVALHELVEITMLKYRLRPRDPYFRWFSDGFANAIAIHLLRANVSEQTAAEFAESYDTKKYAAMEKQINLRYWMGLGYCIVTPLESEKELNYARYSYATLEATRLIDKYGIECVAKILDKACKNESYNNSLELIPAIKEVTGEDMEKRFLRYQTFETKEQGIAQYATSSNAAMDRKDYGRALPCVLRIHEVRGMGDPLFYKNAAFLLFRMGREDAGDQVILSHADFCKERGLEPAYVTMHALFINYAFMCNNPKKAVPSAEIVLESKPDYVPALVIRMVKLRSAGDIEGAKKIAQRILELEENPNSKWREIAEQFQ